MTLQDDTKPRATTSTDDATTRITTLRHRPNGTRTKRARRGRLERRLRELAGRGPAGWGVLLYRFMIGAETTLIVLLLWVAAAGRAPAVGCRGWHVRISI